MFTVTSNDPAYIFPLVGNGEIVSMLGQTGYHAAGDANDTSLANQKLFWAGRRMNTPTRALMRFGQAIRTLTIEGVPTNDQTWEQTMDYDHAALLTTLTHGAIREHTRSRVCLTANVVVFHTRLENQGDKMAEIGFTLNYQMDTTIYPYLQFPYMSHFDFRPGYTPEETSEIRLRVLPDESSVSLNYQIDDQLGCVSIGWNPVGKMLELENGAKFTHQITLEADGAAEFWFWVTLSDRLKYTHFPPFERIATLINEHERAWGGFWQASSVELGDEALEALRKSSLYAIRCNASPWSIPPDYLATTWEGRTFHDELYPFLALISAGHPDLAARVPHFRLRTLPVAMQRSGFHGAHFPWETLESGHEGGPYGHWLDERFHVGQFSETAWKYYLYTRSLDDLERLYPLLRECAELFVYDVLVRDEKGVLKTRLITDFDEHVYPLSNGIFTICSAVRSLENAAKAAELLDMEAKQREEWRSIAAELRTALPADEAENFYKVSDDGSHWHIAQVGMIYPFSIDVESERARETLTRLADALRTDRNATAGSPRSYKGTHWMWATSMLATGFFFQGRAEEGYEFVRRTPATAGPFHSPNEQFREIEPKGFAAPWFTTSSGAVVYAIHTMFVQVDEIGTIILPALPMSDARFSGLLASHSVRVSGEVRHGKLVNLSVDAPVTLDWQFRIPARWAEMAQFTSGIRTTRPDENGLVRVECVLAKGVTRLI
jgi:hypothetical protein